MRQRPWLTAAITGSLAFSAVTIFGVPEVSAQTVGNGAPRWFISSTESIRSEGSDTSFLIMQRLADLYMQSGYYGCTLNPSPNYSTCNTGADTGYTDLTDNYDRVEVMTGIDPFGSGEGQRQLCGLDSPTAYPVDFARSTKLPSSANGCTDMKALGYAKDGVAAVNFAGAEGPGTPTGPAFGSQIVGPLASGWLPGNSVTCDEDIPSPCGGTPFTDISNVAGTSSTAWRLWCSTDTTPGNPDDRITDWGQLTNLGTTLELLDVQTTMSSKTLTITSSGPEGTTFPSSITNGSHVTGSSDIPANDTVSINGGATLTLATAATGSTTTTLLFTIASALTPGNGVPIGVPITIWGVDPTGDTEAIFAHFADSGQVSGGNDVCGNVNTNASMLQGHAHIAPENNASELASFLNADFPSSDGTQLADQSAELAASFYFMANGMFNSHLTTREITPQPGSNVYAANKMTANGIVATTSPSGTLMTNAFPMADTLYNIYRTSTVRASTAGFLNWICDSNNLSQKGTDPTTGQNFNNELTSSMQTNYGLIRLNNLTAAPNNTCQTITSVANSNS